jgi:hypothetical protein
VSIDTDRSNTTGFDSDLSIQAASPTTWRVIAPLIWTGTQGDTYTVPVGFLTDFSTSPRFLHWLWLPYGAYTRAAVLHDWLLWLLEWWTRLAAQRRVGGTATAQDAPEDVRTLIFAEGLIELAPSPPITSRDIDGVFRRAMKDLGVPWSKRWLGWTAVRWGALFNPRRAYGRGFVRDLPKVLGMSLLALPVILPGAIGVLISLGIVRVITWVRPPVQHLARRKSSGRPPTKGNDHVSR